jgi:hypothetical protein
MYNRDITGKVNKDGITLGKVAETAVELSAPVIGGKVSTAVKTPETLQSLGALPNAKVRQTANAVENIISDPILAKSDDIASKPVQTIKNKFPDEPMPTAVTDKAKIIGVAEIVEGKIKVNGQLPRYVDFVVDIDGKLILGNKHHLLGNANDVQAAGRMKINNGKVAEINNLSGHYQPSVEEAMKFPEILRKLGLDLNRTHFRVFAFESTPSGNLNGFPTAVHREFLK